MHIFVQCLQKSVTISGLHTYLAKDETDGAHIVRGFGTAHMHKFWW
jgi:hypothetical protein